MRINPKTAELDLHGLKLSSKVTLEDLKSLHPNKFIHPLISNGEWLTYRIADSEAASQLVFKNEHLWQIRVALIIEGETKNQPSEIIERIRHSIHENALIKEIASTKLVCPDGSNVELCFDNKSLASMIVITYPNKES